MDGLNSSTQDSNVMAILRESFKPETSVAGSELQTELVANANMTSDDVDLKSFKKVKILAPELIGDGKAKIPEIKDEPDTVVNAVKILEKQKQASAKLVQDDAEGDITVFANRLVTLAKQYQGTRDTDPNKEMLKGELRVVSNQLSTLISGEPLSDAEPDNTDIASEIDNDIRPDTPDDDEKASLPAYFRRGARESIIAAKRVIAKESIVSAKRVIAKESIVSAKRVVESVDALAIPNIDKDIAEGIDKLLSSITKISTGIKYRVIVKKLGVDLGITVDTNIEDGLKKIKNQFKSLKDTTKTRLYNYLIRYWDKQEETTQAVDVDITSPILYPEQVDDFKAEFKARPIKAEEPEDMSDELSIAGTNNLMKLVKAKKIADDEGLAPEIVNPAKIDVVKPVAATLQDPLAFSEKSFESVIDAYEATLKEGQSLTMVKDVSNLEDRSLLITLARKTGSGVTEEKLMIPEFNVRDLKEGYTKECKVINENSTYLHGAKLAFTANNGMIIVKELKVAK